MKFKAPGGMDNFSFAGNTIEVPEDGVLEFADSSATVMDQLRAHGIVPLTEWLAANPGADPAVAAKAKSKGELEKEAKQDLQKRAQALGQTLDLRQPVSVLRKLVEELEKPQQA